MADAAAAPARGPAGWRIVRGRLAAPRPDVGRRPAWGTVPPGVAVGLAVLLVAAAMIVLDPLGLAAVGAWPKPAKRVFGFITTFGDSGLYLVPLSLALVGLWLWARFGRQTWTRRAKAALCEISLRLAFVALAVAGTGIAVNVVKRLVGRVRPQHVEPGMAWHFEPLGWKSAYASFPSGHATTAFAVATALILVCSPGSRARLAPWLVAGAVLVCASRVVLGAHFPSDVMAGALFGALGTWWFAHFLARRRLVFRQTGTGALALRGAHASKTLRAVLAQDKVS